MPLMTLQDRITLIIANLGSIKRAIDRGALSEAATFFDAIATCAKEGAEIYKESEDGADNKNLAGRP